MNDIVRAAIRLAARITPLDACERSTGREGRRQEDNYRHAKFWWWFFWPVTLTVYILTLAAWVVLICAVFGILITLSIIVIPMVWIVQIVWYVQDRRRMACASAHTRPASNA